MASIELKEAWRQLVEKLDQFTQIKEEVEAMDTLGDTELEEAVTHMISEIENCIEMIGLDREAVDRFMEEEEE